MSKSKARLSLVPATPGTADGGRGRGNLFELAYQRIESLLIACDVRPGQLLTIQDLQGLTGLGRTPVQQAVNRLAAETLIIIRPRHGLQVAPIDLARERLLLKLRRDLERFVIGLAIERAGPAQRHQMLHMERVLKARRATLTLARFNELDRAIDALILAAAAEPFLDDTLRPLHTMYRRIGFIYHTHISGPASLLETIDRHIAILNAVANKHTRLAVEATDQLIGFVDRMFVSMETSINPSLLDCSLASIVAE